MFVILNSFQDLINSKNYPIKKPPNFLEGFRGIARIRTGVDGFADRCLAARPRRHCLNGLQIYILFPLFQKY